MNFNVLAVGDVVGAPGLGFLSRHLRSIIEMKNVSFTVVNGENANVLGITPRQADEIFAAGANVITLGNHTWSRREIQGYLDQNRNILRPLNFAVQCPGSGIGVYETDVGDIAVINLMGRYAMDSNIDNPFFAAEAALREIDTKLVLVDMHAEGTSERMAMGYFLDGRVSAVWGTHTHVQTSDACILNMGTGYISDLGMTGAKNSILGIKPELSISKFLGDPPERFEAAEGPCKLECAVFEINPDTGACVGVEAMRIT